MSIPPLLRRVIGLQYSENLQMEWLKKVRSVPDIIMWMCFRTQFQSCTIHNCLIHVMKIGCVDCLVKVRGKISKSLPNSIYKVSFDCFTFKMQTVKGKECNTHSLTISAHLLFPLPLSFTFKCYPQQPLIAKLPSASLPPSGWLNEAGASRA